VRTIRFHRIVRTLYSYFYELASFIQKSHKKRLTFSNPTCTLLTRFIVLKPVIRGAYG